jgi:hypothetical protein
MRCHAGDAHRRRRRPDRSLRPSNPGPEGLRPIVIVANLFGPLAYEIENAISYGGGLNAGDVRLGEAAQRLGRRVANGTVRPHEVAGIIRRDFCN